MNLFTKNFLFYNLFYVKELFAFLIVCFGLLHYKKNKLKYLFLIFIIVILFFFRNNLKYISKNDTEIVSPSSSKVIHIKEENDQINVFTYLSPLDRHFAIAPVNCTIKNISKPLKNTDAERVKITCIDEKENEFSIDLIVAKPMKGIGIFGGWVPKLFYKTRIVPLCKVGDTLKKGERYGLIRFGSNMEYFFPKSWNLNIKENQQIQIGTIIGKKNN